MARWLAILGIALAARTALAEPSSGELLARGIQAFDARDYKNAAMLFESALSRGAMSRSQTLTACIDLGATLVALGKAKAAEHAFEQGVPSAARLLRDHWRPRRDLRGGLLAGGARRPRPANLPRGPAVGGARS